MGAKICMIIRGLRYRTTQRSVTRHLSFKLTTRDQPGPIIGSITPQILSQSSKNERNKKKKSKGLDECQIWFSGNFGAEVKGNGFEGLRLIKQRSSPIGQIIPGPRLRRCGHFWKFHIFYLGMTLTSWQINGQDYRGHQEICQRRCMRFERFLTFLRRKGTI